MPGVSSAQEMFLFFNIWGGFSAMAVFSVAAGDESCQTSGNVLSCAFLTASLQVPILFFIVHFIPFLSLKLRLGVARSSLPFPSAPPAQGS